METIRRILGVDPGSRITGVGIIEHQKNEVRCLFGGCVRLLAKEMPLRLAKLFAEIQEIVKIYQPTELAIEQVFVHKNVRAALKLGQARGVAIASAMAHNIPVYEYAPREIKQAIVGKGNADKSQMQHMIQVLLNLNAKPQADCADALSVALCHLHSVSDNPVFKRKSSRRSYKRSKGWKSYDRTIER